MPANQGPVDQKWTQSWTLFSLSQDENGEARILGL